MPNTYPSKEAAIPVPDLENRNLDRSTDPQVMTRGIMGKTSAGVWVYLAADNNGQIATWNTGIVREYYDTVIKNVSTSLMDVYEFKSGSTRVASVSVSYTTSGHSVFSSAYKTA